MNNEQIVRKAYQVAENVDIKGWVESFTSDGTFTDNSIGVTYRGSDGPTRLGKTVEVYAKAFPEMHRELCRLPFGDRLYTRSPSKPRNLRAAVSAQSASL